MKVVQPDRLPNGRRRASRISASTKPGGENRGIQKFVQQAGGVGQDGVKWCAIWVNAKLAVSGILGSGSPAAVSFRNHPNFRKLDGPALGAIVVWNHHV